MNVHLSYVSKRLSKRELKGVQKYADLYDCGGNVYRILDAALERPMPAGVGRVTRHGIITKLTAEVMFEQIMFEVSKARKEVANEG